MVVEQKAFRCAGYHEMIHMPLPSRRDVYFCCSWLSLAATKMLQKRVCNDLDALIRLPTLCSYGVCYFLLFSPFSLLFCLSFFCRLVLLFFNIHCLEGLFFCYSIRPHFGNGSLFILQGFDDDTCRSGRTFRFTWRSSTPEACDCLYHSSVYDADPELQAVQLLCRHGVLRTLPNPGQVLWTCVHRPTSKFRIYSDFSLQRTAMQILLLSPSHQVAMESMFSSGMLESIQLFRYVIFRHIRHGSTLSDLLLSFIHSPSSLGTKGRIQKRCKCCGEFFLGILSDNL